MRCQYCGEELKFERGRGWVHMDGGLYKQYCPQCGWKGGNFPPVIYCPNCGYEKIRDDHIARPIPPKE